MTGEYARDIYRVSFPNFNRLIIGLLLSYLPFAAILPSLSRLYYSFFTFYYYSSRLIITAKLHFTYSPS
jgi:hypothetical protein